MLGLKLNPVQSQVVEMPPSWTLLAQSGFHTDLLERANRFKTWSVREGFAEAEEVLELVGKGFAELFDANYFYAEICDTDPDNQLKIQFVDTIKLLAHEFGDRISNVVWDTLAMMGTRDNPTEEVTIVSQADRLTLPWPLADAVLHSLGKVYGLKDHITSRIFDKTGYVLEHNCDCNHALKAPNGGEISVLLTPDRFQEATAALLSHLLSEVVLIYHLKLPFDLGITPETAEAMAG